MNRETESPIESPSAVTGIFTKTKPNRLNKIIAFLIKEKKKEKIEESPDNFIGFPLWERRWKIVDKTLKRKDAHGISKIMDKELVSQPRLGFGS